MHSGVVVQPLDLAHDLLFPNPILLAAQNHKGTLDAGLGARLELHLDVRRRVGTRALLDDSNVGLEARELGRQGADTRGNVGADGAELAEQQHR